MQTVSFAGSSYNIPNTRGDRPWSGLSDFVIAAASKAINTAGGNFTLLADINFGATFGLVSTYYKSRTANVASAGQIRLANTDTIKFRNGANAADLSVAISSNRLTFEGSRLVIAGAAEIVNADISASAAIALSKLAALTASRAVVTDGSGVLTPATTTATEIGYVNGVTSAIQTQINTKAPAASPTFTGTVTLPVTADRALQTGTSSVLEASAVTKTELGYVSGVTSAIQTQLNEKVANPLTGNLAAGSNKITGLAAATANGDAVRFEQLKVLQAPVYGTTSTAATSTSSTFADTNLSASITPTSASSRILILVSQACDGATTASQSTPVMGLRILRGASEIFLIDRAFGLATSANMAVNANRGFGVLQYIDSPATTSSTTYKTQFNLLAGGDGTVKVQTASTPSTIILIEVA